MAVATSDVGCRRHRPADALQSNTSILRADPARPESAAGVDEAGARLVPQLVGGRRSGVADRRQLVAAVVVRERCFFPRRAARFLSGVARRGREGWLIG